MITALIPAAGQSVRLGQPKQLVKLHGETLVHRAARVCLEAGCQRVLVIEGAVPLRDALVDLPVELVLCPAWRLGPGASLRAGANAAGEVSMLVLLADQYAVTADHLRALLTAKGEIAAAHYANTLGVPARFDARYSAVLRELPDSSGAKGWLEGHHDLVTAFALPEAERDLDSPDQLADFQT
jgi:molybdenum cofactor cytidylyltransferase